jgi:CHAT domain-containing protein
LTGPFSAVPIHAAGVYDGDKSERICCADYFVSSYTPTLTALLRAQRDTPAPSRESLTIALIAEKRAYNKNLQVIDGVVQEVRDVGAILKKHSVQSVQQLTASTTVTDTCTAMQNANIVHLACHGIQDIENATESGFCLGDGRLSISRLMDLKIDGAFLAFLSACETARGDQFQPDQAMHLAAAMLFCGYANVVATMWYVNPLLMKTYIDYVQGYL